MKRKGFKSFVLKVCETKGFADAFLRKCIIPKKLGRVLLNSAFLRPKWASSEQADRGSASRFRISVLAIAANSQSRGKSSTARCLAGAESRTAGLRLNFQEHYNSERIINQEEIYATN